MELVPQISNLQIGLLIGSAALTLIALTAILLRVLPLKRHTKSRAAHIVDNPANMMPAAVVVFAHDDDEALAEMLPQVLRQEYAPGFEVIVVNDGDSADVHDVVVQLMAHYPNLYFTAAPDGARNLSRKKLALTLGIKAAKAPVIVHTTSMARIASTKWLESIMRHFEPDGAVNVVIGYAAAPKDEDRKFGAIARAFDSAAHDLPWISSAVARHPWRGTEHNLAYRRELFFRNKGFSRHLNLRDGDDDIFISEIARGYNTAAELSPESHVEVPGANHHRTLLHRIARRRFTKRFIPNRPRIAGSIAAGAYFLAPLPLIATPLTGVMDTAAWIYLALLFICWYCTGLTWNCALKILHARHIAITTPLLAFTRPIRIASRTCRSFISRSKRYTWE